MAARIIQNTVDVHFRWTTPAGQKCENVFQFLYNVTPTGANLLALATQFWANIGPNWRLFSANKVIPQEVYVVDLDDRHPMATATLPLGVGHQGTRGNDTASASESAHITTRSGFRGPSNKGRKSVSGFEDVDQSDDNFSSQLLLWLAVHALNFLLDVTTGGVTFISAVGSPKLGRSVALLSAGKATPYVGTQDSRLPQHGR